MEVTYLAVSDIGYVLLRNHEGLVEHYVSTGNWSTTEPPYYFDELEKLVDVCQLKGFVLKL